MDEGSYRYILSGSLLGVELKDIRSVPVGYMTIYEMFPLDFLSFVKQIECRIKFWISWRSVLNKSSQ